MGSVSAPGGIREPAPSERRTPPNPRSDEASALALAAPETRRGAIQILLQAIKKALFVLPTRALFPGRSKTPPSRNCFKESQRTVVVSSHASPPPQSMDCDGSAALGKWAPRERFAAAKITEFTSPKVRLSRWKAREYRSISRLVNTSVGTVLSKPRDSRPAVPPLGSIGEREGEIERRNVAHLSLAVGCAHGLELHAGA